MIQRIPVICAAAVFTVLLSCCNALSEPEVDVRKNILHMDFEEITVRVAGSADGLLHVQSTDILGNYPESEFYDTAEVLTSLGIGEALVTALDEKGRPTPLAATLMRAPMSRMDILSASELDSLIADSALAAKYNQGIDRESAYEMLNEKIEKAEAEAEKEAAREAAATKTRSSRSRGGYQRMNPVVKVLTSATFIRGVLGVLKKVIR